MNHPATLTASLDDDQLVQLAELLAPRLADALAPQLGHALQEQLPTPQPEPQPEEWLSPAATADRFAVTTDWLYRHADELGVLRLGDGPKARLRFRLKAVEQALSPRVGGNGSKGAESPAAAAKTALSARATRGTRSPRVPGLLAIASDAQMP